MFAFVWLPKFGKMVIPALSALLSLTRSWSPSALRLGTLTVYSKRSVGNMAMKTEDAIAACSPPPPETKGFFMQQTMLRIKEPKRSLDFYTRVLGMTLLKKVDFGKGMDFSLYFLAYVDPKQVPKDEKEATKFCFSTPATIELTHNWGTENKEGEIYHNGNDEPKGFGHIGIVVPDVYKACERFESLGVPFKKTPDGGKMKGIAFIQDPDGYWIEILNPNNMVKIE